MLHHSDKTDLEKLSLDEFFADYDKPSKVIKGKGGDKNRFVPQLTTSSQYATTTEAVEGARQVFNNTF
eukprot:CAMPEP_0185597926 /NCGR_PEP_ID=MMETSP0434-20130131/81675_1 /TAXON_ID=626734 ORGANISM="Favella taraikaensis, Strain Fe Narragansett Bay" /NCGR_SAMPLE_ID=MMETSP0434 /ASSEMBLY_ACC=CAM_ASM_000379 /LENGTH=67 /DNA_ID=CAMNT_0028226777 /DNA_START=1829 /DNA_END=2029 /DNA_ORIENTATION=-